MFEEVYNALLSRKVVEFQAFGFNAKPMPPDMHPHQAHCTEFAIEKGCAALFLDTGLGKTYCALEWANQVVEHTNKSVLMLAPMAVGPQHEREAKQRGIQAKYIRTPDQITRRSIWITNYERVHLFNPADFAGVVLDESSIIKSFTGATTRKLMEMFQHTPYRLCCTATPAPNDHMELGQHSQFLGVMDSNEMLARWFIADQTDMGKYRLKRGAMQDFWRWVSSWARCIGLPSDIGLPDDGFLLPDLNIQRHQIRADISQDTNGLLFRIPENSATSIHNEKRKTVQDRAERIASIIAAEPGESWIAWTDTNYEADALAALIPDAIEVRGSDKPEVKEERLVAFSNGAARILITKPSIAGFGLNWQHCARVAFVGLSFSYEQFYQAVRRCWRFGQTRPVECHVAMADTEAAIYAAVTRKRDDHDAMKVQMRQAMKHAAMTDKVFHDYDANVIAPYPRGIAA